MPRPDPARRPSARCKATLRSMRPGRCAHGRRGRFSPSIAPHARSLLPRLNCRMQLCRPDMQVTSQSPAAGHCPVQTALSRRRHCRFNCLRFNLCRHHADYIALETCISTTPLPSLSCRFCNMRFNSAVAMSIMSLINMPFSSAVAIPTMSLLQHALQQRRRHADQAATINPSVPGRAAKSLDQRR